MKKPAFLTIIIAVLFCSCVRSTNTELTDKQKEAVKNEVKDQSDELQSAISQLSEKYLIVLDMQKFPVTNNSPDTLTFSQINPINYLIENSNPDKVIYVKSASLALSVSLRGITVDTVSIPDFDKRLKLVNNNVFIKTKGNAFMSKELIGFLKKHEVRKIIVVGLVAEECVYKTILGGKKLGFEMYTVPEAIIGKTSDGKQRIIKTLAEKGIKLLTINEIEKTP